MMMTKIPEVMIHFRDMLTTQGPPLPTMETKEMNGTEMIVTVAMRTFMNHNKIVLEVEVQLMKQHYGEKEDQTCQKVI